MGRTIRQDDIAVLHDLDAQADALRGSLGLNRREETVTWYEGAGGERQYEVVADGYGRFDLVASEGRNPNDRVEHHRATYDDEGEASLAALRLGEFGVAWEDRDTPVEGELDA